MWPGASPSSPLFHEKLAAWAFYSGSDFLVVSARPVVRSFIPFVAYLVPKRFRPSAAPERPVLGAQAARGRAASGEPRPRSCLGAGRGVALPGPRPGGLGGPPGARRTLAWCVHGEAGSLAIGCSLRRGITALHEESPNTILLHVFFHRLADGSSLLRTRAWPAFAGR